jgi:antitoxin ParD1/3/4
MEEAMNYGRNISFTDHLSRFIDEQVESGRHQNASEVVREAVRRYEQDVRSEKLREDVIAELVEEGREAIARGEFSQIDSPQDLDAFFKRVRSRASEIARD